jgi:hypothetical protein
MLVHCANAGPLNGREKPHKSRNCCGIFRDFLPKRVYRTETVYRGEIVENALNETQGNYKEDNRNVSISESVRNG